MFVKSIYSILNNIINILPSYGFSLKLRGWLASLFINKCGENLKISSNVNIYEPKTLSCGNHVYIGFSSYLGRGEINLEDEVIIGPFCTIAGGNHTKKNNSYRFGEYKFGKITIGKGTWIGANCVITANTKIGKGCLIAAGSIVTKNIEDNVIAEGTPAKIIKKAK